LESLLNFDYFEHLKHLFGSKSVERVFHEHFLEEWNVFLFMDCAEQGFRRKIELKGRCHALHFHLKDSFACE
jgi:hypothetical protein